MARATTAAHTRETDYLELDDVVDAAATIVREVGVEGLTMARLAERLGTSVGAAYYHVTDKATLLDLVAERVVVSVEPPPDDGSDWHLRLREFLLAEVAAFIPYRGLAAHMFSRGQYPPAVTRNHDYTVETLERAGFDPTTVDAAVVALTALMQGVLILWHAPVPDAAARRRASAGRSSLPPDAMEAFENALDLVLAGLLTRKPRGRSSRGS